MGLSDDRDYRDPHETQFPGPGGDVRNPETEVIELGPSSMGLVKSGSVGIEVQLQAVVGAGELEMDPLAAMLHSPPTMNLEAQLSIEPQRPRQTSDSNPAVDKVHLQSRHRDHLMSAPHLTSQPDPRLFTAEGRSPEEHRSESGRSRYVVIRSLLTRVLRASPARGKRLYRVAHLGIFVLVLLGLVISLVFLVHYSTVSFLLGPPWFYLFLVAVAVTILATSLSSDRAG